MALKPVPIKPVEAHRLDDPRRPSTETPERGVAAAPEAAAKPAARATPARRTRTPRPGRRRSTQGAPSRAPDSTPAPSEPGSLVNPYARGGRPHQVAVSLYVPQWERIEEQCVELRTQGVRDATVTRWLFAVLHFRAPAERDLAAQLLQRWVRLEASEEGPYFGLRKEARGVRFFEGLWERQRAILTELRHGAGGGPGRPTLAVWTTAVVELAGPNTAGEARDLLRDLRLLLAGNPE
jgi:hypothetical protein